MDELLTDFEGYLVLIGPSITAIVSCILSIVYAFKKVKSQTTDSLKETKEIKREIRDAIANQNSLMEKNERNDLILNNVLKTYEANFEALDKIVKANEILTAQMKKQSEATAKAVQEMETVKKQMASTLKEINDGK